MTGLFVRFVTHAIIDYWHTRRPPQGHFLHMLAAAFAPAFARLLFSRVRRTKSFAVSTAAILVLGGLALVLARRGAYMRKPARRKRRRSRAPLKHVPGRGMPAKGKAGA
jgi:hypothetical protein